MYSQTVVALAALLAACATSKPELEQQAVDDFVAVRGLESVDSIRTESFDNWTDINEHYLIYSARRGEYLIRFARACWEIRDNVVVPDRRWDASHIQARFDTIRGCRIAEIFALTEADAIELRQLGDPPPDGS
jgi:hypothetical protein